MQEEQIALEICQHYRKQLLTNRMWIKGPNQLLPLSIPVGRRSARAPIKEKKISYAENWQKQHWGSWITAYKNSPFFDYYVDDFLPFFEQKPVFLVDLLVDILHVLWKKLGIPTSFSLTESYLGEEFYQVDYRETFDPRNQAVPIGFEARPYPQVFPGFSPGLSIVDLLFNEGPNSTLLLKEYWKGK